MSARSVSEVGVFSYSATFASLKFVGCDVWKAPS